MYFDMNDDIIISLRRILYHFEWQVVNCVHFDLYGLQGPQMATAIKELSY